MTGFFETAAKTEIDVDQLLRDEAGQLGGTSIYGERTTKQEFEKSVKQASLVSFYGHCRSKDDITDFLDQALVLAPTVPSNSTTEISSDSEYLTVPEIFELELKSPVVMLVACGSASQQLQKGDEPLGILSGFLYAGATSVIGTLWKVAGEDGALFTKEFYALLRQQIPGGNIWEGEPTLIDLAVILQEAVRKIRNTPKTETRTEKGKAAPYHWAAYVLHGAWLMHSPVTTARGGSM
jgi:CHAT domain-containing protein